MRDQSAKKRRGSSVTVVQNIMESAKSKVQTTESFRKSVVDNTRLENHTKVYASMCPDEILDYYDNYETRSYYTTLMLGDISGFTEMTEKYTKSKGGPSKLTEILNSYIGAMVQEILSHHGDVLKFSGDAFIVMWKLDENRVMRDIASEAIKTACIIQKHFGTYETEVDVTLRVKLAIASGKTYFTSIGEPAKGSYYIITGRPIWEVKYAEALCRGGDILVASSCWQWVNPNEYIYEMWPDGIHTLIISLSVLWDNAKESISDDYISSDGSSSLYGTISSPSTPSSESSRSDFFIQASALAGDSESTDYSLRPKVVKVSKLKLLKELRSYILRPVVRSVEMDEPLEYLTEIRQVVIVFVNVITAETNRKTLIKLINATFLFVCSVVGEMQGCVNKTSLFDKDLIFLCIFGLRGDKHELESQVGLRCASKLRRGLVKFQNVKSVSVGVTTGMTYCGVVGHVLRREYTVIGMAVNKAARLMCAYINKVVCDRESFLLSHLEAKHFILQEAKRLKGITNVGPVYEFSEQISAEDHVLSMSKYPLLGRDLELQIYYDLLRKMIGVSETQRPIEENETKTNVLVIRGEPRMGKTRLLQEITHITPNHVPVNFISLASYDQEIPYILLHLIFHAPLDLTEATSQKRKQDKLSKYFSEHDQSKLCALNQIFNVNFKMTKEYTDLDHKNRKSMTKKLLATLTRRCFECVWVTIVDDAELADRESLQVLNVVIREIKILFVFSYGNKLSKSYKIPHKITEVAKLIDILGLDKWFHAALACQVMDVIGIPAELEKAIQGNSAGNPGWIESYLISLLQSENIVLKKLTFQEINAMGLVLPAKNMLRRLSDDSPFEFSPEILQRTEHVNRGWEMYQSSFRETIAASGDHSKESPVCILTNKFSLEDLSTEATMDNILLKQYDSLTPLDQYLLKCAAVLGEVVDRKMLDRLMLGTAAREIGLSLTKLFELRILGCAVGDFSRGPGPVLMFKRTHDLISDADIRCFCKGVEIKEDLSDLPNYASCGLMRFKLDMFRETTYRLLTENQKVEFHSKALRYLQQNTRRCSACGGGQFSKLLGETAIHEIPKRKAEDSSTTPTTSASVSSEHHVNSDSDDDFFLDFNPAKTEMHIKSNSSLSLFKLCKPLEKSPTRTFSNVDFTNCTCSLILLTAYTHVLEHCRGIGIRQLLLVAILEFTEVCISTLNIPQATKLLVEGDELIDALYNAAEDELIVLPYLKGKIQTLRGQCFLESGLIAEAMSCFEMTMKIMRYKFPTNPIAIRFKSMLLLHEQHLMLTTCMRHFMVGVIDGDAANYNDQFASCLAQMFKLYRLKEMQDHARLAAIWGLNVALESSKDFFVLCTCYANMMITAHNYQYTSILPYLETGAINLCNQREDTIDLQELKAVAELYTRIFFSRWLAGQTERASKIGFIAERLAHAIRFVNLRLIILPRLIQLLITECRWAEVVTMLQDLEFISQDDVDLSGRTWYYSLCIDLLLETGIAIVTFPECDRFYQEESSKIINLRDPQAGTRFFEDMWLWYVRIDDWEAAHVWHGRKTNQTHYNEYTVAAAVSALRKLEGLIITYVFKLDLKNINEAIKIAGEVKDTFKIVNKIQKIVKLTYPRYLVIKAYWQMVKFRTKYGLTLIRKAKRVAKKIGNSLIFNLADHNEKAWTNTLSPVQQNHWREQCTARKLMDWHDVESENAKIIPFTLPLPDTSGISSRISMHFK